MGNNGFRLAGCLGLLVCLLFCSGCWDLKEVSYLTYGTAIGIDYRDGKYQVYMQALHFGNLAKSEGQMQEKTPNVVGQGSGRTVTEAIFDFYQSAQLQIYWGHVNSLVFSEEALKQVPFPDLVDLINRYREFRYNIWVYGTRDDIEMLFNITPFFGLSSYESIMNNPNDRYKQFSDIKPMYLYQFIKDFYEAGKTAQLPILTSNETVWKEGGKTSKQMMLAGNYYFYNQTYRGFLNQTQLSGKRYMERSMRRAPLVIEQEGKPAVFLILRKNDYTVSYRVEKEQIVYRIEMNVTAYVDEMLIDMEEQDILRAAEQLIARQIEEGFEHGMSIGVDIYNMNERTYRFDHKTWKAVVADRPLQQSTVLEEVAVRASLIHAGKYKARTD